MSSPKASETERRNAGTRPSSTGFALFATHIGRCGIMWNSTGIVGIQLPESSMSEARGRIAKGHPGAVPADPPPFVQAAMGSIARHLAGDRTNLSRIRLDMGGVTSFRRRVYEEARLVPSGVTVSYGELAKRLGQPGSARAVGQALGHNPFPIVVPCHRVVATGGKIGGFSANGGTDTKLRMLQIEGAVPPRVGSHPTTDRALAFDARRAVAHLKSADPGLADLMASIGPFAMELKTSRTTFVALSEAIVYQQLSPKAAGTIYGRFCDLFGGLRATPSPKRLLGIPEEALRSAGLSQAKVRAIRDLAERSLAREIPTLKEAQIMPDEVVIERLTAVRGVGRWTAEMFLMFRLGRPDVLPLGDYGLRRGFALAFTNGRMPEPDQVERRGEKWRPFRTVASWYLWRAADAGLM
jgi:O-6-methylguanine DNA methyltransferase